MKHLRFMLGFLTGAIVVYLLLYRPVKKQQNKEDAVMDEAIAMMDAYEAQEKAAKAAQDNRRHRLTSPLRPGNTHNGEDDS